MTAATRPPLADWNHRALSTASSLPPVDASLRRRICVRADGPPVRRICSARARCSSSASARRCAGDLEMYGELGTRSSLSPPLHVMCSVRGRGRTA